MATYVETEHEQAVLCPVCDVVVKVVAKVKVTGGHTRHVGTSGMRKQISAAVDVEVESFSFNHTCNYIPPKDS